MKILEGTSAPVKIWVDDLAEVEAQALEQLRNTGNLPWVEGVAVMPDVHYGKGATVGSVILCRDATTRKAAARAAGTD
jgi:tRNA-splicing ligase RtcB